MNIWSLFDHSSRRIARLAKRIRDFVFFLKLRHGVIAAWELSGKTV